MPTESSLQTSLLLAAPQRLPELRLFRRNVVVAQHGDRQTRAGLKGQADLYGYVRGGTVIELELKGHRTAVSPEQKAWAAWCAEWGVPFLLLRARGGESAEETVERWLGEIEAVVRAPRS